MWSNEHAENEMRGVMAARALARERRLAATHAREEAEYARLRAALMARARYHPNLPPPSGPGR